MSRQTIWDKLHELGFSDNASAALMGNWEQESGNEACRLQGDFDSSRTKSKNYATTVNNGGGNFIYDSQGWGLAQWTFWSRKQGLQTYCKNKNAGIENENAQVEYAYKELTTQYQSVFKILSSNASLYDMVSTVCVQYEAPAVNNITARFNSAQSILNELKGTAATTPTTVQPAATVTLATFSATVFPEMPLLKQGDKGIPVGMIQYALNKKGYSLNPDCDFGPATMNAIKLFQAAEKITSSGSCDKATWEALWK